MQGLLSLLYQICEGDVPQLPDHYDKELKSVALALLLSTCTCSLNWANTGQRKRWGEEHTQTHTNTHKHTQTHTNTHTHSHALAIWVIFVVLPLQATVVVAVGARPCQAPECCCRPQHPARQTPHVQVAVQTLQEVSSFSVAVHTDSHTRSPLNLFVFPPLFPPHNPQNPHTPSFRPPTPPPSFRTPLPEPPLTPWRAQVREQHRRGARQNQIARRPHQTPHTPTAAATAAAAAATAATASCC